MAALDPPAQLLSSLGLEINFIVLFCELGSRSCWWNVLSADHSIFESDVIEIVCEVQYAGNWWTPVIQCLPETLSETSQVVSRGSSNSTVRYRQVINATSQLNGVKFDCHVSSANIHLWTSPVIIINGEYFSEIYM